MLQAPSFWQNCWENQFSESKQLALWLEHVEKADQSRVEHGCCGYRHIVNFRSGETVPPWKFLWFLLHFDSFFSTPPDVKDTGGSHLPVCLMTKHLLLCLFSTTLIPIKECQVIKKYLTMLNLNIGKNILFVVNCGKITQNTCKSLKANVLTP